MEKTQITGIIIISSIIMYILLYNYRPSFILDINAQGDHFIDVKYHLLYSILFGLFVGIILCIYTKTEKVDVDPAFIKTEPVVEKTESINFSF